MKKTNSRWYIEHINDPYVKQSKRLNYRSRAAFKLLQIEEKYKILGKRVLDLGAAPGSWSQVASQKDCQITSVDLINVNPIQNMRFIHGDIFAKSTILKIKEQKYDTILSDMAPNFSGDHEQDHQQILLLNAQVLLIAYFSLIKEGNIVMKTLQGGEEKQNYVNNIWYQEFLRQFFNQFYREKPLASKSESTELFYVGKGFKDNIDITNRNTSDKRMSELIIKILLM